MNQVLPHDFAGFAATATGPSETIDAFWLQDSPMMVSPPAGNPLEDSSSSPPPFIETGFGNLRPDRFAELQQLAQTSPTHARMLDRIQYGDIDQSQGFYQSRAQEIASGKLPIAPYVEAANLAEQIAGMEKDSEEWVKANRQLVTLNDTIKAREQNLAKDRTSFGNTAWQDPEFFVRSGSPTIPNEVVPIPADQRPILAAFVEKPGAMLLGAGEAPLQMSAKAQALGTRVATKAMDITGLSYLAPGLRGTMEAENEAANKLLAERSRVWELEARNLGVDKNFRQAGESLAETVPLAGAGMAIGGTAKAATLIGQVANYSKTMAPAVSWFAGGAYDSALDSTRDMKLPEWQRELHALGMATFEAAPMMVLGTMGTMTSRLAGAQVLAPIASVFHRSLERAGFPGMLAKWVSGAGTGLAGETAEELVTAYGQAHLDKAFGVNPDALKEFGENWRDIVKTSAIAAAGGEFARGLQGRVELPQSLDEPIAQAYQQAIDAARQATQGAIDAQGYEGPPPRTERRAFSRDTKRKGQTSSAYREGFSQAVAIAQSPVTSQVQTENAGRFDSQTVDTSNLPQVEGRQVEDSSTSQQGPSVEIFPQNQDGTQLTQEIAEAATDPRPVANLPQAGSVERVPQFLDTGTPRESVDQVQQTPSADTQDTQQATTAPQRPVDATPDPMVRDTTLEAQELANAELDDLAKRYADSQQDRQQLTPQQVENLNAELRKFTSDTELIRDVMAQGSRDVRIPSDVLSLAQEYYDRDQELYRAATSHLTQLDIPWQRLIKEINRDEDREVQRIPGWDDALMALTRARFGDDFVQDNVDVAADELRNLLDGAELRFGQVVFPGLAEPPTKEAAMSQAYSDIMEGVRAERAEEEGGWNEYAWQPEEGVYLDPPTEVEYDPSLTTARMKWMRKDRDLLGLDPLDSPERRTWQQALQSAKERGLPERALRIATEVNAEPRALDDRETAGLVVRAAELKNEHRKLLDDLAAAETDGDEGLMATLGAEVDRVGDEFDIVSQALRTSGTEKGRSLASQKLTINQDFDLTSILSRATAAKRKKISPSERRAFQAIEAKLRDAEAKLAEAELAAKIKTVEAGLGIGQRGRNRTRPIPEVVDSTYDQLAALLSAGCEIG